MDLQLQGVAARHPAARPEADPSLQPLDLKIGAGEQVAVIGASGAGKTTLLQVLALAMRPAAGTLSVGELKPWALPRRALQRLRGQLFLAPQLPPLPPRQRVVAGLLAGRLPAQGLLASVRSLFYPSDIPAAHDALDRFDVADKLFERVDRLSGGERERVGLAPALVSPAGLGAGRRLPSRRARCSSSGRRPPGSAARRHAAVARPGSGWPRCYG